MRNTIHCYRLVLKMQGLVKVFLIFGFCLIAIIFVVMRADCVLADDCAADVRSYESVDSGHEGK